MKKRPKPVQTAFQIEKNLSWKTKLIFFESWKINEMELDEGRYLEGVTSLFRREERKYNKSLQDKRKEQDLRGVSSLFKRAVEEERRLRRDWGVQSSFFNWTQEGRKRRLTFPSFPMWRRSEEERRRPSSFLRREGRREERRLLDEGRSLEGVAPLFRREERGSKKRLRDQREEGALEGVEPVFERGTHVRKRGTAFRENVVEYEVEIRDPYSVWNQLRLTRSYVGDVLRERFDQLGSINFREILMIRYKKPLEDGVFQESPVSVKNRHLIRLEELEELLDEVMEEVNGKLSKYDVNGSGWVFDTILSHDLHVSKYDPLVGSSYLELPKTLRNSMKGLVNVKNNDDRCFLWCHVRHLRPQERDPNRVKKENRVVASQLNYRGIRFPVEISQVGRVEKQNEISINIFGYENKVFKLRSSSARYKEVMNLLLIERDGKSHYVLIKDFNRLMFNITKDRNKKHFCMHCLQHFSSGEVLAKHEED